MRDLKKIGNILSLAFCLLLIVFSFFIALMLLLIAPGALESLPTSDIIPYARTIEMTIFGLLFANFFMIIGIVGLKSERQLIVYGIGIVIIVIYIGLELYYFILISNSIAGVSGEEGLAPIFLSSFTATLICIIGILAGYVIRITEAVQEKRKK